MDIFDIDLEKVASVCHEANRQLQVVQGDPVVSPHWDEASTEQKESAKKGAYEALVHKANPKQLHELWALDKAKKGWIWGPTKSEELQTHPCMVPYEELPFEQRLKDYVFQGIVKGFADAYSDGSE